MRVYKIHSKYEDRKTKLCIISHIDLWEYTEKTLDEQWVAFEENGWRC